MSVTFCTSLNAACAAQVGGATGAAAQWVNRYGMLHRKRPCRGRGETDHHQIEARPPTGGFFLGRGMVAHQHREKRTTGRLMACKRYSDGLFTCHAYMDVSVGSFQPPYASCL